MAIVEMKRMTLIGLEEERENILKTLQNMGQVEVTEIRQGQENELPTHLEREMNTDSLDEVEGNINDVKFALEFLGRYKKDKKGLLAGRHEISLGELNAVVNRREEILKTVKKCRGLDESLTAIRSSATRLINQINQMQPWEKLNIPLEEIQDTDLVKMMLGTIDKVRAADFEKDLSSVFQEYYLEPMGVEKEDALYFLMYHRSIESEVDEKLKSAGFSKTTFAEIKGKPQDVIKEAEQGLQDIEKKRQEIAQEAEKLVPAIRELEILFDGLTIEQEKQKAALQLLKTGQTFYLEGWIPANSSPVLEKRLASFTDAYQLYFRDPLREEIFPVAMNNPALVKPFEMITELYSTPNPRGIDPNVFMAPFYFAFFGMMVSDAGYGIVLAVAAYIMTKALKLKGGAKKLGLLISLGGVSTFLWGALFGGWFGNAGAALGIRPLWFDPMENPLLMLGLCFALGIVQIFYGMGIQAYINIKRGRPWDAVFDQGLWYILIIGLLSMALPQTAASGKILAIFGAVGLVLTQGRDQKGLLKKAMSGVLSLYNITGYLSDVLSYSRLFALGLATGVIAMVINQLGVMVGNSVITWIFAALILVGGHLFNILINSLGAFVHASRLQYIEFFGKFFEGGGHAFQPLSIRSKYNDIYEKEAI